MTTTKRPAAYDLRYLPDSPDTGGWKTRHAEAVRNPRNREGALVASIQAWLDMATIHEAKYDLRIGRDFYACDHWAAIGTSLRDLLNLDWGSRLDMGTLDAVLVGTLEAEGFDVDMHQWKEGR